MNPRQFRTHLRWPGRRLALPQVLATGQLLAAVLMFASITPSIFAQHRFAPPQRDMITEIWMSGKEVAVSRRIPIERRAERAEDDEFARSMAQMAEQRFKSADRETAGWLVQCAQQLSDGRIGANGLATDDRAVFMQIQPPAHQDRPHGVGESGDQLISNAATVATSQPTLTPFSETESRRADNRPAPLTVDPRFLSGQPIDQANGAEPRPRETLETSRFGPAATLPLATQSASRTSNEPPAHAQSESAPQSQARKLPGSSDREVALAEPQLVPLEVSQGGHQAFPKDASRPPTLMVLLSFTAGFLFCVGLVALITLTPRRPSAAAAGGPSSASAEPQDVWQEVAVTRNHERSAGRTGTTHTIPHAASTAPAVADQEAAAADKTSALVEDFFNCNVEMLKQCA